MADNGDISRSELDEITWRANEIACRALNGMVRAIDEECEGDGMLYFLVLADAAAYLKYRVAELAGLTDKETLKEVRKI